MLSGLSDSPTEKFYSLIPHFLNLPISVKRYSIRTKVLHRADFFFRFDPKYKNFEFEAKVFHDFAYNKAILYDNLNVGFHLLATMTYPDPTFATDYREWLDKCAEKGCMPSSEFATYNSFCKQWQGYPGKYKEGLVPKLLEFYFRKADPPIKPNNNEY